MSTLNRKMWRDLWRLKGQAFAIGLVIMSGVATFIMFLSTLDSLQLTRATYYQDYRFAEVFSSLKRAPQSLRARIADIPGVDKVETRVVAFANLFANLRSAKFAVEVARHELEAAKTALQFSAVKGVQDAPEKVVITSPINGSVLKINRESEGVIAVGQNLIEVGDPPPWKWWWMSCPLMPCASFPVRGCCSNAGVVS